MSAAVARPALAGAGALTLVPSLAPLLSAALVTLAFPPFDMGPLAWIAVAPLAGACIASGAERSFARGLAFGIAVTLGVFHWMFAVPGFGLVQAVPLTLYLALYPALWCAALPRLARSRMPLPLTAAAWWVALDWVRAHAGFLALPWGALAHTQHDNVAALQLAAVTGEAGITALAIALNVALARALREPRTLGVVAAIVLAWHAAGLLSLRIEHVGPRLTLAAVQHGGVEQRLEELTSRAARAGAQLVVWPESAMRDTGHLEQLAALAGRTGTTIVAGIAETQKIATGSLDRIELRSRDLHNSAWLVEPGRIGEAYRKQRLLPFAETLPMHEAISWPAWLVGRVEAIVAGPADPAPLRALAAEVGVLICWEGMFADLARASARQGAQVLVQPTNDAWSARPAAAEQHNLASVLRAVELAMPVAVASTTGPSHIVDARGRVVARIDAGEPGATLAAVTLRTGRTPYARWGDSWLVLALACVAAALTLPRRVK